MMCCGVENFEILNFIPFGFINSDMYKFFDKFFLNIKRQNILYIKILKNLDFY